MALKSTTSGREDPISPYSLRRKSVQVILAMALILIVNVTLLVQTIATGDRALVVLASICLALFVFTFYRLVRTGLRSVALEIWIRHMGEGNLDYRVELAGNDEVNEAADALERLRQRSIEAQQLDLVRELSDDLQQKNDELQRVLLELQQTQDQIILRQKLVELGELTAGVAHEIRNPLNFMKNFSEASEELVADINDLLNDRAMIAYHSALALYEDFEIDINSDCDASVGEMKVVPEDMGRVFLNLVGNACSAMDEKRRMVEEDHGSYKPTLWLRTERTGAEVVIRIRDNGTGIPADSMDKIFNPFYTTKPSGTGVGLGLSLSSDVVRRYGGSITAQSEPGKFTEMTVRLPAADRG